MEKAWIWIKEHPIAIVGVIGVLVIAYMLFGSSGGGGTATSSSGPTDTQVAADAQLQMAQINAGVQSTGISAALAATQSNNAAQVQIAGLSAQVAHYQTEQAANVQEVGISAQKDVSLAGIQSQQVIALANAATEAQIVSLNDYTTQVGYKENTKQLQAVETANVQLAQTYVAGQVQTAKINADVQKHSSNNGLFGGIVGAIASII
ncbi:MAG TPA: hypothetical protein VIY48_05670 [Candidatus Paceibacterota bacterium]